MRHEGPDDLSDRSRHLLRVLVESYIRDGEPVGSRTRDHAIDDVRTRSPDVQAAGHRQQIEAGLGLKFSPLPERTLHERHVLNRLVVRLANDPAPSV